MPDRSLVLRQEVGDTFAIALLLEDFAGLAARQRQWERTATLLGAAEGLCVAMRWTPPAVPDYERAVHGARGALGEAGFAAAGYPLAGAAGRALSLEDAVAFALEAGRRKARSRNRGLPTKRPSRDG